MAIWWLVPWCVAWLAAGGLLREMVGGGRSAGLLIILLVIQLVLARALPGPPSGGRWGGFRRWLGAASAGFVGGIVGVAAVWSVLFFRGGWEFPLTILGWLVGAVTVGVIAFWASGSPSAESRSRSLSGLLLGLVVVSLAVLGVAALSLATTHPNWLFRFPQNQGVRELWVRAQWTAVLVVLWAVGVGCLMKIGRRHPAAGAGGAADA